MTDARRRASLNTVSKAKSTEKPDETKPNRLTDLVVEEISLVDRPANKRRFSVVKRAGGAEMVKAKADKPKDEKDPKAAFPGAAPPFEAKSDDADATAKAKAKADAEPVEPPVEPADEKPKPKPDAEPAADEPTKTAKAEEVAPAAADDAAPAAAQPEPVEKAGKVLAMHRMAKLREAHKAFADAHKALGDLISEMEPEAEPDGPSAGVAMAKAETAPTATPAAPEPAQAQTQKNDALQSTVSSLAKSVAGLAALVARQQSDIATIRKAVPASSAVPAEGTAHIAKRGCGWPRDMARPEVESELSFR